MNKNKANKHLFFYEKKTATVIAIFSGTVILLTIFSYALPIIRIINEIPFPALKPTFLLPSFWQLIALIILTILVTFLFTISLSKTVRYWLFLAKYKSGNYVRFVDEISYLIRTNDDSGELQQVAIQTIFMKGNIDSILSMLQTKRGYVTNPIEEHQYLEYLFNTVLTDKRFIQLITHKDKDVLLLLLESIKVNHALGTSQFVEAMVAELIASDNSLLSLEMGDYGDGISEEIFQTLFSDSFFYNNFSLYDGLSLGRMKITLESTNKLIKSLDCALKDYYADRAHQTINGRNSIVNGLEIVTSTYNSLVYDIYKLDFDEITRHPSHQVASKIEFFVSRLEQLFFAHQNGYTPDLSESEELAVEYSVTEAINNMLFEVLEKVAMLSKAQDYARIVAFEVDWIWASFQIPKARIAKISMPILKLIDERVRGNLDGGWAPMTRVLLSMTGISKSDPVGKILEKYKKRIVAKFLDEETRQKFLPDKWTISKDRQEFYNENGGTMVSLRAHPSKFQRRTPQSAHRTGRSRK